MFTLLDEKIKNFSHDFQSHSKQLFVDEGGNLVHSGEFGMYREKLAREFISNFIPQRMGIDTGFLINSQGKISTQCDIVIYDKTATPLMRSDNLQTFFPIESVCAVGEVKSKVTLAELKEALIKLTKHKALRDSIFEPVYVYNGKGDGEFRDIYKPELDERDQIFTFVICDSFDFDISKKNLQHISECYSQNNPKRPDNYKHNLILSVRDGLIAYLYEGNILYGFPTKAKLILDYSEGAAQPGMRLSARKLSSRIILPRSDKFSHLRHFCTLLHSAMHVISVLFPDMSRYIEADGEVNFMDF